MTATAATPAAEVRRAPERGPTAPVVRFAVLDAADPAGRAAWLDLWRRWPDREVWAHPEYGRLFARPSDRVVCLAADHPRGGILYPLLLRPLAAEPWASPGERRLDATTPYGYGGPFAWGEPDAGAFWREHAAWCAAERVVTTFARLSLFPGQLAPLAGGTIEDRGPNVAVPLGGDAETLWQGYDTRVRRWIRVAEGSGLRIEQDEDGRRLDGFIEVYEHTMRRHEAGGWYYFPRALFEALRAELHGQYVFFHALDGERVVSSDLVLRSARHAYYFLGGTLTDAFPQGPNYLVKHAVARWAQAAGLTWYVLGGGYRPDDGVYRYKRGWARRGEHRFRVGCWTHDAAGVGELAERRAAHALATGEAWSPQPGWFPMYRS